MPLNQKSTIKLLLILYLSAILSIFSACSYFADLSDSDLSSSNPRFENVDEETFTVAYQKEWSVPLSNSFPNSFTLETALVEQLLCPHLQFPLSNERVPILRC